MDPLKMSKVLTRAAIIVIALAAPYGVAETIVITNVTLIPMTHEEVIPGQSVLVKGDRIFGIGDDITIPDDATRIDGSGKFLIPGLAEMHGHTPIPDAEPDSEFVRNMMFLYVANGVTTVRGMLGADGQLQLRDMIREGKLVGPTLYLAGPSFNGNTINSPEEATARVKQQVAEGWDLLKVHPGLTRAEYDAMAKTASKLGIRFGGHVPEDIGLMHALRRGHHTFEHIDGYLQYFDYPEESIKPTDLDRIASISRSAGAWIVPTLVLWERVIGLGDPDTLIKWQELKYWPRDRVDSWYDRHKSRFAQADQKQRQAYADTRQRILKALHDRGVGILMGTDSPQLFSVPGFSIHREMAAMAEAGMSNYNILRSGTRNVGTYLQGKDAFGSIALGHRADLILLNQNPLANIAAVKDRAGVMVRGRWISESEIQERLETIAR